MDKTLTLPHVLDHDTLKRLAARSGGTCVSVYLPTHRAGGDKDKDPIRLKNLLRSAEEQLVSGGMRATAAESLLAEVRGLQSDPAFWREMGDGLALFICDGDGGAITEIVKVGVSLPSQVVTGNRFYLRPLVSAWRTPTTWALLSVDQKGSALYLASHGHIEQLELDPSVPLTLADELKYDVLEESLQSHTPSKAVHASHGHAPATFHGHGGSKDVRDVNLTRWLTRLASGVAARLGEQDSPPLILAGVDYELDLYRSINSYPNLRAERVTGSTARRSAADLHAAALTVLGPDILGEPDADLAELTEKESSPLASRSVCDIVAAATLGRVKTLFVDESSVGPFGTFDSNVLECDIHAPAVPRYQRETMRVEDGVMPAGTWDLVDMAVAATVRNGGTVHALVGEDSPVKPVAAIYRY